MRSFRDIPIEQKLMVIIMSVAAAALLLAGLGIVITDSYLFRGAMQRDISALAQIVADNSTAALAFNDPRTAADTLASLGARPHLLAACIYRPVERPSPAICAPGQTARCPAGSAPDEMRFTKEGLVIRRSIMLDERRIGSAVRSGRNFRAHPPLRHSRVLDSGIG